MVHHGARECVCPFFIGEAAQMILLGLVSFRWQGLGRVHAVMWGFTQKTQTSASASLGPQCAQWLDTLVLTINIMYTRTIPASISGHMPNRLVRQKVKKCSAPVIDEPVLSMQKQ